MNVEPSPARTELPELILDHSDLFVCPACRNSMRITIDRRTMECDGCDRCFESEGGIPLLFWPNEFDSKADVTAAVRSFYEDNPFLNYEDLDSEWSLKQKAEEGVFVRLLNEQIPHGAKVLEVGCGTGQLGNYLGIRWGRTVFGADLSLNALKLGQGFRQNNDVGNVAFIQMDLFKPVSRPESFDVVICNGVLHHTSDPYLGLQMITSLVKSGGFVIIGLYNRYGRVPTTLRRLVVRLLGSRFAFLDSRVRNKSISEMRRYTWFMDQYQHPHESSHTLEEVNRWFERTGLEFVNSIPKATAFSQFASDEHLFTINPKGTHLDRFLVQAQMLFSGGREGGFFLTIGRKMSPSG